MDFLQEIQTTNIYMYDDFEYEDDVFYSELRKQVLQLTAEDDDDQEQAVFDESKNLNMVAPQKGGHDDGARHRVSLDGGYYNWPRNKEEVAAPAWIMNLWKTGNGTGVFIPQIVQSKKKNRPRRRKNERGRTYRRVEKF
ncbi:hypothetical protein C2S53_004211 [Perilla frutescens var. hirtella]|uniref:Uncharacterized protein n=1 Tax=Perilla frutescens var. hirtella TaxID=608512 RepID=A0AAD4PCQ9_PERFH|nr:hypothetical protein C2S53_004211 [Perilla frutescens var. hirtella]